MQQNNLMRTVALILTLSMIVTSCAPSIVQIRPPYQTKLRPGDGVKVLDKSGTVHSGKIVYLDNTVLILRTPKQVIAESPVKKAKFGTSIPWEIVHSIKVAGTLDSQKKLISNEEIRVNVRTNLRQKLMANMGLLGLATGFLIGASIQENIAPADPNNLIGNHGRARFSFWTSVFLGTAAGVGSGYQVGTMLDTRKAIDKIERARAEIRRNAAKTAQNNESVFGRPMQKYP